MNTRLAVQLAGWLLVVLGAFQLAPVAAALIFGEPVVGLEAFEPPLKPGVYRVCRRIDRGGDDERDSHARA